MGVALKRYNLAALTPSEALRAAVYKVELCRYNVEMGTATAAERKDYRALLVLINRLENLVSRNGRQLRALPEYRTQGYTDLRS